MPKLSLEESHAFWKNYEDPMIYRVVSFMETAEEWTLDGQPALERSLAKLGDALDQLTEFDLGKEEQFIVLCAHLKTSRILRLLQAIDTLDPGSASKLLMYAEEHNTDETTPGAMFLRRNIVFERLRLLARVFSPERFELALKILEQDHAG